MKLPIMFYMIQVVAPNVCTKFQNPRRSSSLEIFYMQKEMERKGKKGKKEGKINFSIVVFFYTIYFNPQ